MQIGNPHPPYHIGTYNLLEKNFSFQAQASNEIEAFTSDCPVWLSYLHTKC